VLIAVRGVPPTTDVQSARFARWIDLDNRILCSGCGAGYDDYDEVKQNTYIFCPNCGARMDGDVE
jgi:rubredoxin